MAPLFWIMVALPMVCTGLMFLPPTWKWWLITFAAAFVLVAALVAWRVTTKHPPGGGMVLGFEMSGLVLIGWAVLAGLFMRAVQLLFDIGALSLFGIPLTLIGLALGALPGLLILSKAG